MVCGLGPLGAPHQLENDAEFVARDQVKVELDPDVWKELQQDHGGWNDFMSLVRLHQYRSTM